MSSHQVIEPHKGDKRYARRGSQGQFADNQVTKAKTTVPKKQGGRGYEKRS